MFTSFKYPSKDTSVILGTREDDSTLVIEPSDELWTLAVNNAEPYQPSEEEVLAAERSSMRCRAAAMRLVLIRVGKLEEVQAIADNHPEASIVWEYEPEYVRNSPFIEALGGELFTPEEVDDLFREAMKL